MICLFLSLTITWIHSGPLVGGILMNTELVGSVGGYLRLVRGTSKNCRYIWSYHTRISYIGRILLYGTSLATVWTNPATCYSAILLLLATVPHICGPPLCRHNELKTMCSSETPEHWDSNLQGLLMYKTGNILKVLSAHLLGKNKISMVGTAMCIRPNR